MTPVLVAIIGTLLLGLMLKGAESYLSRNKNKALPYDANKVREIEKDIWGMTFTPAPEVPASNVPALSAARPMHELNARVRELQEKEKADKSKASLSRSKVYACTYCDKQTYSGDVCQKCLAVQMHQRRVEREKAAFKPRQRIIEFQGVRYKALIPSEVPDDAFVEINCDPGSMWHWAYWKWTDKDTGQTKGLKSSAQELSRYDIHAGDNIVKRFYA